MSIFGAVADSYVAAATSYAAQVTADGPIGWWKCDDANGTSTIAATVGSNGTSAGTTLSAAGLVSDGGTGIQTHLSGTGDSFSVPFPTRGTAGSIVVWYKFISATSPLIVWRDNTSTNGWFIQIDGTNPVVRVAGTSRTITAMLSSALKDGARHRITLTTDGSTVTLLVDGVQIDQWTKVANFSNLNTKLWLGQNGSTGSQLTSAVYDDVAIYDKVLTPTRDAAQYAAA